MQSYARASSGASEYFIFENAVADRPLENETVVFASGERYELSSLVDALREHHETHEPPARVVLLGSAARKAHLLSLADATSRTDLAGITGAAAAPELAVLTFGAEGTLRPEVPAHEPLVRDPVADARLTCGLRTLFRKHDSILDAPSSFHYVTPTGRHTRRFIRAANVFRRSAEIAFAAFGLLRWCPADLRSIYTDTAGINAVAYALVELKRQLDESFNTPSIASFSSHEGLEEFHFEDPLALCLISASTTGRLERRLRDEGKVCGDRIVTLFRYGELRPGSQILCDLTPRGGDGLAIAIESYEDPATCAFCRSGSKPIAIGGDQLLPSTPTVGGVLLTADDEPPWLAGLLNNVLGQDIVRCYVRGTSDTEEPREIHFELTDVFVHLGPEADGSDRANDPLRDALRRRLVASVPVALDRIVHLDDPASKSLAEAAAALYRDRARGTATDLVVSESAARELHADLVPRKHGNPVPRDAAILVVSAVVSTGRSLVAVSQFLRGVRGSAVPSPDGSVVGLSYIVGIAALPTADDTERLRRNVTFGRVPAERPFAVGCIGHLPPRAAGRGSSWSIERRLLDDIAVRLGASGSSDPAALAELEDRRERLIAAERTVGAGLRDDELFLLPIGSNRSDKPEPLALRPGFVFWRQVERAPDSATQAEVYLTVACVLHHLRQPQPPELPVMHHDYNRTVLAPANFERFNDGVIQASLLRAARGAELDYRDAEDLSNEMLMTLRRFATRMTDKEGEAFPEFLLALAARRLRLVRRHEELFARDLSRIELPPLERALTRWWSSAAFGSA
jgi:hypothetical protein